MSDEILQQLQFMGFDWLDVIRAVNEKLETHTARIAELEAALRNLDDMIVDLDAGHTELHQVSRFINTALSGG